MPSTPISRAASSPPPSEPLPAPSLRRTAWRTGGAEPVSRVLPEELPVALVYNGGTQAVMMATPADLVDFATGFTLTEGLAPKDALPEAEVEVQRDGAEVIGIEARMWLGPEAAAALAKRRRASMGPVGCGLCGIDSLEQALRPLPDLSSVALTLPAHDAKLALEELRAFQPLHDATRAVHAAGFWQPGRGIVMAREDVGRHNALDKLIGAVLRAGLDPATGAAVVTSRLSVEMVQKAAMAGMPVLMALSAPTAQAVRSAESIGLTLACLYRGEVQVFAHPHRIAG